MTSPDSITQIAAPGVEPTYSAREAARLLGRSYSWLDQRLRAGQFVLPDGTTVQPLRTSGRYRRFTIAVLRDIATSSYRQHWFSMDELKSTFLELAMAAHRDTGEYKIPG
jgi:hypothetical protein